MRFARWLRTTVTTAPAPLAQSRRPSPREAAGLVRFRRATRFSALVACLALGVPLAAKDSLGVFGQWGAFRDPAVPRCYAISAAQPEPRGSSAARKREFASFASVGTWPRSQVRGQLHLRLSRTLAPGSAIRLAIGSQRFNLTGSGADAWAPDRRMDAAVTAAMRSVPAMSVSALDRAGRRFTDRYVLDGTATAMDAATVGCASLR